MTETIPLDDAVPGTATSLAGAAVPASAPPPLGRNRQFQTLWVGSAAATLGLNVADVAYPLAILAVTGSPAETGWFRLSAGAVGRGKRALPASAHARSGVIRGGHNVGVLQALGLAVAGELGFGRG